MESNHETYTIDISTDYHLETEAGVNLYVRDYGHGKPVILIHGWPLSGDMFEYQIEAIVNAGYRVIAYDRRGFGKSSQPWDGYDYDSLSDDLKSIIDTLELTDVTLVGFSMGGGEVARYFGRHHGENVSKAVLIGAITPFMLKTDDNDGIPQEEFDKIETGLREDRAGFLSDFAKTFYGVGLLSKPVSEAFLQNDVNIAMAASPRATLECMKSFSTTDFRDDLPLIKVPTLVIHGDSDKTVPVDKSAEKAYKMIGGSTFRLYEGAPHGLMYTHREQINQDLIAFLAS